MFRSHLEDFSCRRKWLDDLHFVYLFQICWYLVLFESIQHQTAVGLSSPGEKVQQHQLISHNGKTVLSKQQSIRTNRPAVADYEMSLSNRYVPLQAVECI